LNKDVNYNTFQQDGSPIVTSILKNSHINTLKSSVPRALKISLEILQLPKALFVLSFVTARLTSSGVKSLVSTGIVQSATCSTAHVTVGGLSNY
jgi:hypothetical protein